MSMYQLTPEQEQVVHHPPGYHARVLAVAGSGKSTTMAHRIKYLIYERGVHPRSIQVLMFNALARRQFQAHLDKIGLPEHRQPVVHTFHSYAFYLINQMIQGYLLPSTTTYWLSDKTELIWLTVKRAITELEKSKRLPPDTIDPQEAMNAISLWKGALIPPERAGSYASAYLPQVYEKFEELRQAENALTFDDFVPLAIHLLKDDPHLQLRYCQDLRYLIVDEYQDINYGQQRLIEILAGKQAEVMVVGDDDQTIYEWRGARSNYIIQDFGAVFNHFPVQDYRLSRSFRFGPLIAQCAANVIACNHNRVEKPLVAFQAGKSGFIQILSGGYASIKELAEQVMALVEIDGVSPTQVIVLARLFAQLDNLEAEFLNRGIPYRVDGQAPFYERREIKALLDYLRLGLVYWTPMSPEAVEWLVSVANKPARMLSRSLMSNLGMQARYRRSTPQQMLNACILGRKEFYVKPWQAEKLRELLDFMEALYPRLVDSAANAGEVLAWMVDELDYLKYFQDYYGIGENADEKAFAVGNFIRYVQQLPFTPQALLAHLEQLDTTQGKPEDELIIFTTIFRTKGLEYDYVIIPECDENLLPYLKGEITDIYDTEGLVKESSMSTALENERRLFYVAITRARQGVFIGTSPLPSHPIHSLAQPSSRPDDIALCLKLRLSLSQPDTFTKHLSF